jgi:CheY-like chemotaxis protein
MDMHEGSIGFESPGEGHGSLFYFILPVVGLGSMVDQTILDRHISIIERMASNEPFRIRNDASTHFRASIQDEANVSPPHVQDEEAGRYCFRVLVVDDSGLNRKLMRKRLEKRGFLVTEADDGDVACQLVADSLQDDDADKFDVITMDNV